MAWASSSIVRTHAPGRRYPDPRLGVAGVIGIRLAG